MILNLQTHKKVVVYLKSPGKTLNSGKKKKAHYHSFQINTSINRFMPIYHTYFFATRLIDANNLILLT